VRAGRGEDAADARPRQIAASLLAADLAALDRAAAAVEGSADRLHFDVMDGRFVPNLTMGAPVLEALRRHTALPVDCHLMVEAPDDRLEAFARAGAAEITVHVEASPHLHRTLERIRDLGVRAGAAVCPATPLDFLPFVLDVLDSLLVMTVEPGFGGQRLIEAAVPKIAQARRLSARAGRPDLVVAVDGGVDTRTASRLAALGADRLVAGTAIYGAADPAAAVAALRRAAWTAN
jgi:ribulose-phosphate 3-epimerase